MCFTLAQRSSTLTVAFAWNYMNCFMITGIKSPPIMYRTQVVSWWNTNHQDAFKYIKIDKEPQAMPPVINWCQESASTHLE